MSTVPPVNPQAPVTQQHLADSDYWDKVGKIVLAGVLLAGGTLATYLQTNVVGVKVSSVAGQEKVVAPVDPVMQKLDAIQAAQKAQDDRLKALEGAKKP